MNRNTGTPMYRLVTSPSDLVDLISFSEQYHKVHSPDDNMDEYSLGSTLPQTSADWSELKRSMEWKVKIESFCQNHSTEEMREVIALYVLGRSLLYGNEKIRWDEAREFSQQFDHNRLYIDLASESLHDTIPEALRYLRNGEKLD